MAEQITRNIVVNAEVTHVYDLWSRFEDFPKFMKHVESVTRTGPNLTHWVMKDPMGRHFEWDAETTRMEPNKRIAWNSRDGGDLETSGQVLFSELPSGQTTIAATVQFTTSRLGAALAGLLHQPAAILEEDLESFKQMAEATTVT